MVTVKTGNGIEFAADFCGVSSLDGDVVIQKEDPRPLHEIAQELEGAGWIERVEYGMRHDGPFAVRLISRENNGQVQIVMRKEAFKQ